MLMTVQAAKQPHQDIASQETERAVRLSEHLLYLQRQQRQMLVTTAKQHSELAGLLHVLSGFTPASIAESSSAFPPLSQVYLCLATFKV